MVFYGKSSESGCFKMCGFDSENPLELKVINLNFLADCSIQYALLGFRMNTHSLFFKEFIQIKYILKDLYIKRK